MRINVIAFGGLGGSFYSTGLKTVLMRLEGIDRVDFKAFESYTSWRQWAKTLSSWRDPSVLIGHSFGVTAALAVARSLPETKFPLLLSFDPSQWWWTNSSLMTSGGNGVPANVLKTINFYQRSGFIGRQTLSRTDGSQTGIENVYVEGPHHRVEDLPAAQARAVTEIKALLR